jgi:hypothetical protein
MKADRAATIAELRYLLKQLREDLAKYMGGSLADLERKVAAVFLKAIERDLVRYRETGKNVERWQWFLDEDEGRLALLAAAVRDPARPTRVYPAPLYDKLPGFLGRDCNKPA